MIGKSNANSGNGNITSKIQSLNGTIVQLLSIKWITSTIYTGYYEQSIPITLITTSAPEWGIFPTLTPLPTETEQTAFDLIDGLVGDTENLKIIFIAKVKPTTDINIHVKGVTVGSTYTDISSGIQQVKIEALEQTIIEINNNKFPSETKIPIPGFTTNTTIDYIAPSDGYAHIFAASSSTALSFISILDVTNNLIATSSSLNTIVGMGISIPVRKGHIVRYSSNATFYEAPKGYFYPVS